MLYFTYEPFWRSEAAEQTKNVLPLSFRLAAGGLGGAAQKNERKIFGFAARAERAPRGASGLSFKMGSDFFKQTPHIRLRLFKLKYTKVLLVLI